MLSMQVLIPDNDNGFFELYDFLMKVCPERFRETMEMMSTSQLGMLVTIEQYVPDHTTEQVGYYRKWCREFAHYCGMTPDEMHEEILCEAYGSEDVSTRFGIRRRPLKRSSSAKRGDYSHLIDTLVRVAADLDFEIPPPIKRGRHGTPEGSGHISS